MFPLAKIIDILPPAYLLCRILLCLHLLVGKVWSGFRGLFFYWSLLFEGLAEFDFCVRWTPANWLVFGFQMFSFCWVSFQWKRLNLQSWGGKLRRTLVAGHFWLALTFGMDGSLLGKYLSDLSSRLLVAPTGVLFLATVHISALVGSMIIFVGLFLYS